MKQLLVGMALAVLVCTPSLAMAQSSLPGSAQGVDIGGQASRATSEAASRAAQQAVEDARKEKNRAQAEAEQKTQAETKKVTEPPK